MSLFKFIRNGFRNNIREQMLSNTEDSRHLNEVLDIYYEFPPVIKKSITRWGDSWDDDRFRLRSLCSGKMKMKL